MTTSMARWDVPELPNDAVCPIPQPIDYKSAKATYAQVRKDTNYKMSVDANRREAARRLGTDYDTFTAALLKQNVTAIPKQAVKSKPIATTRDVEGFKTSKGVAYELRYDLEIAEEGIDRGFSVDMKGNVLVHNQNVAARNIGDVLDRLEDSAEFGDASARGKLKPMRALLAQVKSM